MKKTYDIFIVGGGVNGCGIARDAVGRGYQVGLAEMNDFASATSSSSTKLFHGGLRYLEFFEFGLVREALMEREILLQNMPHISWPMRFVLPLHKDMRFDTTNPASRMLSFFMPWMKGRRPNWMIRFGLFLYDTIGGRKILPGTTSVNLATDPVGQSLHSKYKKAFEYSDCWVDDARLVVLNACDAAARGADMMPRTKVIGAEQSDDMWYVTLLDQNTQDQTVVATKVLINASGPWVEDTIQTTTQENAQFGVRLVRGSHIVIPRKTNHDKAYFFQGGDGRITFAIPYEDDFTLIGTTDAEHENLTDVPEISEVEIEYLIDFVNGYFADPVRKEDIVWTYSGVRPLFDEGEGSATAATRDYVLKWSEISKRPLLNIFGGKITTYRHLAMSVMAMVDEKLDRKTAPWTDTAPLPGGDFDVDGGRALADQIHHHHPYLDEKLIHRYVRQYGTYTQTMLSKVKTLNDMGQHFGAGLFEIEVDWLQDQEWAQTVEDILWRRTKLGLRKEQIDIKAVSRKLKV